MRSITKNRLSNEQIRTLIRANFGSDATEAQIKELKGGMFIAGDLWGDQAFWEGYTGSAGKDKVITERDRVRLLMYRLYIYLIMAVEVLRYGFFYGKGQQIYTRGQALKCLTELESIII